MSRVDEFDSFYRSSAAHTLGVTYALTGDRAATRDAVIHAYRNAWRDWVKIRQREPLAYVRDEAASSTVVETHTHPIRHHRAIAEDGELIDALGRLPLDARRMIVLMTLGHTDLESAAAEVGLPIQEGVEVATDGLDRLERELGQDLTALELRLDALADVEFDSPLPSASEIRHQATRGHQRATVAIVALAVIAILSGGAFAAPGMILDRQTTIPDRERLGAEGADAALDAARIDPESLLAVKAVATLDPGNSWTTSGTDDDARNDTPYATCPTERFATKHPLKVFVRTHEASTTSTARVVQSIEIARSQAEADAAFAQLVTSFANCQHPRVQLVDSYGLASGDTSIRVLRLVSHRSPIRTFTVGFSHNGAITNTLVHEVDGTVAPPIDVFAHVLDASIGKLCQDSGGTCTRATGLVPVIPPPTTKAPEFLSIVDLPPVANVDHVWATVPTANRSAAAQTLCKEPGAGGDRLVRQHARNFVIPEAGLPQTFGIAQVVSTFATPQDAAAYLDAAIAAMTQCPKANLSAKVRTTTGFGTDAFRGQMWRLAFETSNAASIDYLTSFVLRDKTVSQITFTPAPGFDMSDDAFRALADRAAQRLALIK